MDFFLRYTDLDTLCFRLNEGRNYKYPGMGVDILPLRGKQRSRLAHLWTRAQEVGWNELADYYGDRKGRKKAICRLPCGFAWSQDAPVWEKAFTACFVKG